MDGHRGSHSPENHRAAWCAGNKGIQTSQQSQRTNPSAWLPVRGLHKPSEHHVKGKGCGQGVSYVCPALWSLEPKAPVMGSLTPTCTSAPWDKVCFLTSTCVTFTPWPLLNSPAPFLTSLHSAQSLCPSSCLSGPRPRTFSPPGFCMQCCLCLQHSSPHLWARWTPLHPSVQLSAYSALPQGAFPDSSSWTRPLPPRDSHHSALGISDVTVSVPTGRCIPQSRGFLELHWKETTV